MLGETQGTSAGGLAEAGKFLRVPGTNPFFAYRHEWQANRLRELLESSDLDVYLLNTGTVGGPEGDDRSLKVRPAHSSAIVAGIAAGTITWERDPDFGYEIASAVPGLDAVELFRPARLYESQGRSEEYKTLVEVLKEDRRQHLARYSELLPEIAAAV
jgi:phosphoenolpyruvate carboxykinase (ATP)